MAGVERADSVTWCLHKMMGINQQCAAFLTKESNLLVIALSFYSPSPSFATIIILVLIIKLTTTHFVLMLLLVSTLCRKK